MKWHFFHKWVMVGDEHRGCTICHRTQAYSAERNKWEDFDYLANTDHVNGEWLQEQVKRNVSDDLINGDNK